MAAPYVVVLVGSNNSAIFNHLKQKLPSGFKMTTPEYTEPEKSGPDNCPTFSITCTILSLKHEGGAEIEIREQADGTSVKRAKDRVHGIINGKIKDFVSSNSSTIFHESNFMSTSNPNNSSFNSAQSSSSHEKKVTPKEPYLTKADNKGYLGKGGFGQVFCVVKEGEEKKLLALKVPKYEEEDEEDKAKFDKELELHKNAQENQFVAKIIGVAKIQNRRALIMEYCARGSLSDLTNKQPIAPSLICRIHKEIIDALEYLHESINDNERITHNDLKPDNVLITEDFSARLSDFGGSTMATRTSIRGSDHRPAENAAFTSYFLSPEQDANRENLPTRKCDIYSFGVCLYASLCKLSPDRPFFQQFKSNERATTKQIRDRLSQLEQDGTGDIAEADILYELLKIIHFCCVEEPEIRPNAKEVHNEIKSYFNDNKVSEKALKAEQDLKAKLPLENFIYDSTWVNIEKLKL